MYDQSKTAYAGPVVGIPPQPTERQRLMDANSRLEILLHRVRDFHARAFGPSPTTLPSGEKSLTGPRAIGEEINVLYSLIGNLEEEVTRLDRLA